MQYRIVVMYDCRHYCCRTTINTTVLHVRAYRHIYFFSPPSPHEVSKYMHVADAPPVNKGGAAL